MYTVHDDDDDMKPTFTFRKLGKHAFVCAREMNATARRHPERSKVRQRQSCRRGRTNNNISLELHIMRLLTYVCSIRPIHICVVYIEISALFLYTRCVKESRELSESIFLDKMHHVKIYI